MYELWRDKHISKPSEYWNMSIGDKLVTRAFHYREVEERNRMREDLEVKDIPVFPTTMI